MTLAVTLFLVFGTLAQIDRSVPPIPALASLFMSRGVDSGPAFLIECRNTTNTVVSSGSTTWALTRGAIRVDGRILDERGQLGPGLTTAVQPGGMWRGIIELRQSVGPSWPVALGALTRIPIDMPLSAGRHTIAVRCAGVWSDDVAFYWEK